MITTKEQQESFRIAAEPLMLWLEENCHPHCTAIVDSLQAELVEGLCTKGAEAMSEDMPIGHTVYGQVESTDTPIADRLDTNGGAYATDEVRKLERENARLREELELIRAALTGDDYASLPSDLPTVRMAHTVRADHDKFRNQVRDTCHRAEQAEARALAAEKERLQESQKFLHGERMAEMRRAERAEAERDAALKDAERYRYLRTLWMRDHFSSKAQPDGDPDSCDASIDAARKGEQ